jgi:hypothetical protein
MKNSSRFSIVSLLLLAAFPVTPARAQHAQEGPPNPPSPPLNQSFPGPLGLADFGKIISGEFTGDLKRDAVVMNGSSAELLFAPECYDTAITVDGGPFNDIATLSGLLPYQDYDLTVGYTGLTPPRRHGTPSRSGTTPRTGRARGGSPSAISTETPRPISSASPRTDTTC